MEMETMNSTAYESTANATFVEEIYRRKFSMNMVGVAATVFLALTSIGGNLAVVFASYWNDVLRSQTSNILLVYLSVTDVLTGLLVMFPSAIAVGIDYWPFGGIFCRFHAALAYWFACSSSFNLALISIDRALAVTKPLQYPSIVNKQTMIHQCVFLFSSGITLALLTVGINWTHYDYAEGVCAFDWSHKAVHYITTCSCVFCHYFPASVMGLCNSLIILSARKQKTQKLFVRRKDEAACETSTNHSNMKKTIKSMVVIIVTYYCCHSPYGFSKQLKSSIGLEVPPWFSYLTSILMFVSSATNPFIYGILRKDYRNAYKKIPRILKQKFCSKF